MDMSIMQLFPVEPGMAAAAPQSPGAGPLNSGGLNFAALFASLQEQWPYPLGGNGSASSETNAPETDLALPLPGCAADEEAPDSAAVNAAVASAPPSWAAMPLMTVVDAGTVPELAKTAPENTTGEAAAGMREMPSHSRGFSSAALIRQPAQPASAVEEAPAPTTASLQTSQASMAVESTGHSEAVFRVVPAASVGAANPAALVAPNETAAHAVAQESGDASIQAGAQVTVARQAAVSPIPAQSNAAIVEMSNVTQGAQSPLPAFVLTPSAVPEAPANAAAASVLAATEAKPLVRVTDLPPPVMNSPAASDTAASDAAAHTTDAAAPASDKSAPARMPETSPQPVTSPAAANEASTLARLRAHAPADEAAQKEGAQPVATAHSAAAQQRSEPVDTVERAPMLRSAQSPDAPRVNAPAPDIAQESAVSGVSPKVDTPVAASVQPLTVPLRPHVPEGAESIAGQAIKSVRYLAAREGEQRMTVRLVPESLGEMRVELRSHDGELSVRIVSANPVVRETMQAQVHELRQSLSREGIEVGKVDIAANMSQNMDSGGRHSQEAAQQAFRAGPFSRTAYGYAKTVITASPRSQAWTHDGALNVFV